MSERRLELFQEYMENGFDGRYERTTYDRLIVDEENPTATLEVEVEKRTFPAGPERQSISRYQIKVMDLVRLIREHGTRIDGQRVPRVRWPS